LEKLEAAVMAINNFSATSRRGSTLLMVTVRDFSSGCFRSQDVIKAAMEKTDTKHDKPGLAKIFVPS